MSICSTKVLSSKTQGLWVDFKSGRRSPSGHCPTRLVPNSRSRSGIWLVPENLYVFLPNHSEVCFRVLSCVLTRICTRSSVAHLVCLGRATKLCPGKKFQSHNVREINQIFQENLTRNYAEYFRRYCKRTYLKVCEVRIKHSGCRRYYVALNVRRDVSLNLSRFLI